MPNSYTAVPSIIPGNLTVQGNLATTGNLTVTGNTTTGGNDIAGGQVESSSTFFAGVRNVTGVGGGVGSNLLASGTARVNAANPAWHMGFDPTTGNLKHRILNAAGNAMDLAGRLTMLTDYVQHANTGNTTENTIYSKVIRGGLLGANGGIRITLAWLASVQGGVTTNVRIRLNGLTVAQEGFALTGQFYQQTSMINQGAANAQLAITIALKDAGVIDTNTSTALGQDTSVDSTLTITAQNGTATDNQFFRMCEVELLNTFGPV